ncbi:rSAM-modified peptide [Flavobacterium sp. Root420]|nr:rSAM-modified peptide [Flavobacterium sp. Root420]
MANQKLKFEDFEAEKLSKNQQKTVRGGDGETDPEPRKGGGGNG